MVARDILDIFTQFESELGMVESELSQHITSSQPDLHEICEYLSRLRGKRFRPLVVILSYKVVGGKEVEEIIPLASALELIHTATLIHDDINDNSTLRRGHETVYNKFGMSKALIMGDYLFSIGFKLGGSYGKNIVELVAELSTKLAEGEFIHLRNARNPSLDESTYLDIIERKTSGPIIGGAKIGAIVGKGTPEAVETMGHYGRNLGMAFQIIDDILDITGTAEQIGKPVSADLKNGKLTLPIIYALEELEGEPNKKLIQVIENDNVDDGALQEAIEIIKSTNSIANAKAKADSKIEEALKVIEHFESNEYYQSLVDLAKYTVDRDY
ncbi:MAG: polyprenyl synthetase family protein [Thermoplasmata archaeon]|nr:MAG: polyprenyl synthetase family protein [Thermoplasmata archaeon]